jgi:cyclopropane fatty-acyl-phospholipid synthase-like methyltransferase
MRGEATGVSNYTDYKWMPEATGKLAENLMRHLQIRLGETLLDYGCSRGYLVRAMRERGVNAFGYDISEWATTNCDETVRGFVSSSLVVRPFDWIISKDVLEHIEPRTLMATLTVLNSMAKRGMFFIVPLAEHINGEFVCPKDRQDKTHINCWTMEQWLFMMMAALPDFEIHGSYLMRGLKPNAEEYPMSCAFITAKPK